MGNKTTKTAIISFCIVLFVLMAMGNAFADTMVWKNVGYAKDVILNDVPDYKGHITGTFKRVGLSLFKDGSVGSYIQVGTMDADDTGGPHQGYTQVNFEDGSSFIYTMEGKETTPKGKMPQLKGTGKFIQGTGRFEGIEGTIEYSGRYYTSLENENKGGAVIEIKAQYKLPK